MYKYQNMRKNQNRPEYSEILKRAENEDLENEFNSILHRYIPEYIKLRDRILDKYENVLTQI